MLKELNFGKKCKIVTPVTPFVTSVTPSKICNVMFFRYLNPLLRLLHLIWYLLFITQIHSTFYRILHSHFHLCE